MVFKAPGGGSERGKPENFRLIPVCTDAGKIVLRGKECVEC